MGATGEILRLARHVLAVLAQAQVGGREVAMIFDIETTTTVIVTASDEDGVTKWKSDATTI